MQRAVDELQKSVKDIDDKMDQVEWKVAKIEEIVLGPKDCIDNSGLVLISSVRQVKDTYEEIKNEVQKDIAEHNNFKETLQNRSKNLQKRLDYLGMNLKEMVNE